MAKRTSLRLLSHNANGISNDRLTLQELLHNLDIDIALICETRLPTDFVWRNPGYRTYKTRGPSGIFGGTAVLVRANIQHAIIKIPMLQSLQATAISVELEGFETVIGAVYQSPNKPLVEEDLDKLIGLSKSKKFIFGGDLNAKHTDWNSRLVTTRGRTLARHADKNMYAISAPDSPTYYSHRTNVHPDVLDIYLHRMELPVKDVETLDELNSDHNPVLLTVDSSMTAKML
jgi:Exonuclease III